MTKKERLQNLLVFGETGMMGGISSLFPHLRSVGAQNISILASVGCSGSIVFHLNYKIKER